MTIQRLKDYDMKLSCLVLKGVSMYINTVKQLNTVGFLMSGSLTMVAMLVALADADFYNPRYDDFDVRPILENNRILLSYTKCFLDEGPCTPDGKDFKKIIPEALETSCGKCSPKQKQLIRQVIKAVMERQPESWSTLVEKYDKDKKYRDDFKKFIKGKE